MLREGLVKIFLVLAVQDRIKDICLASSGGFSGEIKLIPIEV